MGFLPITMKRQSMSSKGSSHSNRSVMGPEKFAKIFLTELAKDCRKVSCEQKRLRSLDQLLCESHRIFQGSSRNDIERFEFLVKHNVPQFFSRRLMDQAMHVIESSTEKLLRNC